MIPSTRRAPSRPSRAPCETSRFTASAGDALPARGVGLRGCLGALPLLFKKDVRATLPRQWAPPGRDVRADLASGALELVETSGSTGDRLRILWDEGWWMRQEARAMRTNELVAAAMDGARGAYRESILTTPACGLGTCHIGDLPYDERVDGLHLFLSQRPDPLFWTASEQTRILDELTTHGTVGLESDPLYLAILARFARAQGRTIDVRGFVQLTYAMTTRAYLRAIAGAYAGPVLQLYGASEVGVMFMEGERRAPPALPLHHARRALPRPRAHARRRRRGARGGDDARSGRHAARALRRRRPRARRLGGGAPVDERSRRSAGSRAGSTTRSCGRTGRSSPPARWIARSARWTGSACGRRTSARPTGSRSTSWPTATRRTSSQLRARCKRSSRRSSQGSRVTARPVTAIPIEPSGKFRVSKRHFPLDLGARLRPGPTLVGADGGAPA